LSIANQEIVSLNLAFQNLSILLVILIFLPILFALSVIFFPYLVWIELFVVVGVGVAEAMKKFGRGITIKCLSAWWLTTITPTLGIVPLFLILRIHSVVAVFAGIFLTEAYCHIFSNPICTADIDHPFPPLSPMQLSLIAGITLSISLALASYWTLKYWRSKRLA
jgi:hypothetical protein